MSQQLPPIATLLARTSAEILADGRIEPREVRQLATLARSSTHDAGSAATAVGSLIDRHADSFVDGALGDAKALLGEKGRPMPRPKNSVFEVRGEPDDHNLRRQQLFLRGTGTIHGDTGIPSYSRGWLQFNQGVLTQEHGSRPPGSMVMNTAERKALDSRSPGQRLDQAAQILKGGPVGMSTFDALAKSKAFNDPSAADFAGVCYAWSWAALDARLSQLVDVAGPKGQRGLWIAGEWLSRADLGNWLMATLAGLSQGAGDVMWFNPEAEDLLKAALGYLMEGGTGFRADIGPALENPEEIWFQPFVGADVAVNKVPAETERQLLSLAAQPSKASWGGTKPGVDGAAVRLVEVTGRYGDEVGDDHEGDAALASMTWAAYAVLDADGKMMTAYLADDPRLSTISGLPVQQSKPVPRELFAPDHAIIDGILKGEAPAEVKGSVFGPHLEFLVGTVLARGVPGATRAAFEQEPALKGASKLSAAALAALAEEYPTIANAYSPEQWERHFGVRGLERAQFGG